MSTYYTYCELAQWSGINSGRHSECLLCTRHARTMYLLCTGYARTMYLLCTYCVLTVYRLCTYHVLTVYLLCTGCTVLGTESIFFTRAVRPNALTLALTLTLTLTVPVGWTRPPSVSTPTSAGLWRGPRPKP